MNLKNKSKAVKILRVAAIFILLLAIFKGVLVLVILMLLSLSMSYIVNNFHLRQFGFELVTFTGVISGIKFGPLTGMIISFFLITYHMLAGGFFANYLLWVIPAYSLSGLVSGFFPAADPAKIGLYISIGINLNNSFWTALTSPAYLPKYMVFVVTNILFNALLFSLLAKPILLLMI